MPAIALFAAVYPTTLIPPWKLRSDAVKITFPAPRSTILRPDGTREHELARQVHFEDAVPLLIGVGDGGGARDRARIVDEDVDGSRPGAQRGGERG